MELPNRTPISILIVDDHPALRTGMRLLIDSDPELRVIGEVSSGEEAYAAYRAVHPDVVVMDLSMEGYGGLEAINRIHAVNPAAAIIVFSVHDSGVLLDRALTAGAKGYVTKGNTVDILLQGIKSVAQGKAYISPDMVPALVSCREANGSRPVGNLTQREFQIFQLLSSGKTLPECAKILNLSQKTVSNHFTLIRKKLGVASTAEMARMAIRLGVTQA